MNSRPKNENPLLLPVRSLRGASEKTTQALSRHLGIETAADLIWYFPHRYENRTTITPISHITDEGQEAQVAGVLESLTVVGRGRRFLLGILRESTSGEFIYLLWFNNLKAFLSSYQRGKEYIAYGTVRKYRGRWAIAHPRMRAAERANLPTTLMPVYSVPEKLRQKNLSSHTIARLTASLLQQIEPQHIPEILPERIIKEYKLMERWRAFAQVHYPDNQESAQQALYRIKFEELFLLQLALLRARLHRKKLQKGYQITQVGELTLHFLREKLPFPLTTHQKQAIRDIYEDMRSGYPMNRLLQGDVGSGKTIVAIIASLIAASNDLQVCVMVPTEILAHQHLKTFRQLTEGLRLQIHVLTSSVSGRTRQALLDLTERGIVNILIGTHALIEEPVRFRQLGLVIIDEQHRFGVAQRARLLYKSEIPPHLLVMTATPIPRTLALTMYGDLDISVIKEMPPGRKPPTTLHFYEEARQYVYHLVKNQLDQGNRAFFIYPLIEESESLDYQNLTQGYEQVNNWFAQYGYRAVMLHGRMPSDEKQKAIEAFADGSAQIIVSTNVVEVGINVPEATIIVVESAERFGLSQLHQMRGRVCRSSRQPFCILITGRNLSQTARARIKTMLTTTDGFLVAEADMRLRGPGDLLGIQQSGLLPLRAADLVTDQEIVVKARKAAATLLRADPTLRNYPLLLRALNKFRQRLAQTYQRAYQDYEWERIG